eukprot:NODE_7460_length_261_cov_141.783019_g6847_i0.p2 GENE.NODE_7460_length_261_cov_141.783019_g6847_i0~~NODE_7460_length_261_cov_141.783019_g6847_i0.p2  ORF type:complete len:67 (+),score=24.26 NODE_7460_length_261_cov_141.783019_g6847_i0:22-201(+)
MGGTNCPNFHEGFKAMARRGEKTGSRTVDNVGEAFKTKQCKFFKDGQCKNGDNCTFSHE